jgi:hypothetical protein
MPWTRKFDMPIVLPDGRTLTTLAKARLLLRALPGQRRQGELWLYAIGLMAEAATSSGISSLN